MIDLDTTLRALEKTLQQAGGLSDREGTRKQLQDLVHAMSRDGVDRDLPVREIPARLGDRWSSLLMILLSTGTFRHSTLRRLVSLTSAEGKISQRMLTLRLRTLERDGLVSRRATDTHPPGMEYELTDLGRSLLKQIESLMQWTRSHNAEIMAARTRFNARQQESAANLEQDD